MAWTRPAYQWLIWLFILGLGVQFFLAGLGVMGGESIEPHEGFGSLLSLVAVLLLIVAAIGRMGQPLVAMTVVLALLTFLQMLWTNIDDPEWLRAFHVLGAFLIVGLAYDLARRAGFPLGSRS